jgi:ketosteroid isomerase-like protein
MQMKARRPESHAAALVAGLFAASAHAALAGDADVVGSLDTRYQAAVERNDVDTMASILHSDFVLVTGRGKSFSRQDLLDYSRAKNDTYEHQVEVPGTQIVRMYGQDTAIVTALLWIKGTRDGGKQPFDYKLWFSDTYVRTADGWKYAFGQASLPLPAEPSAKP